MPISWNVTNKEPLPALSWNELQYALEQGFNDDLLKENMLETLKSQGVHELWNAETHDEVWSQLKNTIKTPVRPLFSWRTLTAAASIILIFITSGYYLIKNSKISHSALSIVQSHDVAPGGNRAILTLANGVQVVLDSIQNGVIGQQGTASILKSKNGSISYNDLVVNPTESVLNTLTTPRGGQYQLILPDGTKVWLNAASSIQYPSAFTGNAREVRITGEVYFEVKHDTNKPFKVKVRDEEITVLGTHFNVSAYDDEQDLKTTLLEGSISLKTGKYHAILKPGQQSKLNRMGAVTIVNNPDLEQVLAWKNGIFKLTSAELPDVLRQVSRWYDVTVVFEGGVPAGHLTGKVSRNLNLSEIAKVFEYSGFKISIDGKKMIVKP